MKLRLRILSVILFVLISVTCKHQNNESDKVVVFKDNDPINFERDWKDANTEKIVKEFPVFLFQDFEYHDDQVFQSYAFYKYNIVERFLDSCHTHANFHYSGIYVQDVFFSMYKDENNNCYYEMSLDNSCCKCCNSSVPFKYRKEISESIYNGFFMLIDSLGYWDLNIKYWDNRIPDGTTYFFEVRDSTQTKYVICNNPELDMYDTRKRKDHNELVKFNLIGNYFIELCDFPEKLGYCKDVVGGPSNKFID